MAALTELRQPGGEAGSRAIDDTADGHEGLVPRDLHLDASGHAPPSGRRRAGG
jgi:hypothetical protein